MKTFPIDSIDDRVLHENELASYIDNLGEDESITLIFVTTSKYTENSMHKELCLTVLPSDINVFDYLRQRSLLLPQCNFLTYFEKPYKMLTHCYYSSYISVRKNTYGDTILGIGLGMASLEGANNWRDQTVNIRSSKQDILSEIRYCFQDHAKFSSDIFINTLSVINKIKSIF